MSARLALGAAAALAGLAALRARQGSRSTQSGVRFQRASNERIYQAMREKDDGFIGVEVFKVEPGKESEVLQSIRLIDLWLMDEAAAVHTRTGDKFVEKLTKALIGGIDEGIEYFSRLSFPIQVYRGLRYSGGGEPRLVDPGVCWTPDLWVSKRFADGIHFASSRGDTGRILTAVLSNPEDVDWAHTLALYVPYSASSFTDDIEWQIRPLTSLHVRDVRVLS